MSLNKNKPTRKTSIMDQLLSDSLFSGDDNNHKKEENNNKDPLASQVWRMYTRAKDTLPNGSRMENLTWRMMAMTLHKKKLDEEKQKNMDVDVHPSVCRQPDSISFRDNTKPIKQNTTQHPSLANTSITIPLNDEEEYENTTATTTPTTADNEDKRHVDEYLLMKDYNGHFGGDSTGNPTGYRPQKNPVQPFNHAFNASSSSQNYITTFEDAATQSVSFSSLLQHRQHSYDSPSPGDNSNSFYFGNSSGSIGISNIQTTSALSSSPLEYQSLMMTYPPSLQPAPMSPPVNMTFDALISGYYNSGNTSAEDSSAPSPPFVSSPHSSSYEDDDSDGLGHTTKYKKTTKNTKRQTQTQCYNCHTTTTPLWRRDPQGHPLCNACGLFLKLHGAVRPLSLKTDVIKKRNRNTTNNPKSKVKKPVNKEKNREIVPTQEATNAAVNAILESIGIHLESLPAELLPLIASAANYHANRKSSSSHEFTMSSKQPYDRS